MTVLVPEQLRALAFVAEEDLESGRNFMSGCLDLKASRAEKVGEGVGADSKYLNSNTIIER